MNKFEFIAEVGRGAQHIVGMLKDGRLLKVPYWKGWWDKSTPDSVREDIRVHHEVGNPIPDTDVVEQITVDTGSRILHKPYGIITEFVQGEQFKEKDLLDPQIESQLNEILKRSIYIRSKLDSAVDFLGGEAFSQFFNYLLREKKPGKLGAYNLLIDKKRIVRPIDTHLLSPERTSWAMKWFIRRSMDLQHTLLAYLLENEVLINQVLEGNHSGITSATAKKLYNYSRKIEAKRQKRYDEE